MASQPQRSSPIGVLSATTRLDLPKYDEELALKRKTTMLLEMFYAAEKSRWCYEARFQKNYEYYLSWDEEYQKYPKDASKLFIPRPYLVVETRVPMLVFSLVRRTPIWRVIPHSPDEEFGARLWEKALTQQFNSAPNPIKNLYLMCKDACIYGNGIAKTGWEYRETTRTKSILKPFMDPITRELVQQREQIKERIILADRPTFQHIDLAEFYPDPQADCIERCNYIVHRQLVSRNLLKEAGALGIFANVDAIPAGTSHFKSTMSDFANRRFTVGGNEGVTQYWNYLANVGYDLVELLEFWWHDPQTGERQKTVIANRSVVIQDIEFPYDHMRFPFYNFRNNPMSKEFWSWGEIDPIFNMCKERNDLRNMMTDNRAQFLKGFWVVNRMSGIDIDELIDMPIGGVLESNSDPRNALEVFRPPVMDASTYQAEQQLDSDIQITSGANDIAIGGSTRSQVRTATTGSLMAQATERRFNMSAVLMAEELRKIGRDLLALNQQFLNTPIMVRMVGSQGMAEQFYKVNSNDIPRDFDMSVQLDNDYEGDRQMKLQTMLQLLQFVAQMPNANTIEYMKDIMRSAGLDNYDRYFPEIMQMMSPPIRAMMPQLGMDPSSVSSSYKEIEGGMIGGKFPPPGNIGDMQEAMRGGFNGR